MGVSGLLVRFFYVILTSRHLVIDFGSEMPFF